MDDEMKECPICGELIKKGVDECPYCHGKLSKETEKSHAASMSNDKSSSKKSSLPLFLLGAVILLGLLAVLMINISGPFGDFDYSDDYTYSYKEEEEKQVTTSIDEITEPNNDLESVDFTTLKNITVWNRGTNFETGYFLHPNEYDGYESILYIKNIRNNVDCIDFGNYQKGNVDLMVSSIKDFAIKDGKIYFIGNYDGTGAFSGEFVFYYDMAVQQVQYCGFFFAAEFVNSNCVLKVTEKTLVKEGTCAAENEYEYKDTYYNL